MLNVEEINQPDDLHALASTWQRLLAETRGATFFQSLDWLLVYWRHYGKSQKLRVLVVRDGDEPVGILPLVVRRERTRAGTLRVLTYPLDYWGSFYSPIGGNQQTILEAALRHIRRSARDWDILELRFTHPEDLAAGASAAALQSAGFTAQVSSREQTAIVSLRGRWDDYLASRTSKWRNNYRRWERRLTDRGTPSYVRFRPRGEAHGEGDPRWDLYEACEAIAARSWQASGNGTPGTTLTHQSVRSFLRDVHAAAARCGAADVNLLLLDGQPLAFAYNYHYRGYVYGLRIGYDASLAKEGAGNLLYARAIQGSFELGDHTYDFGPGSIAAKQQLLTETLQIHQYSHYAPAAVRAQIVRLKRAWDLRARPYSGLPTSTCDQSMSASC